MINERIVFMGTPNISAKYLSALIKNNYNIIAVYTQSAKRQDRGMSLKNSPVQSLSIEENIPCFTPEILKNQNEINKFKYLNIDLAIIMGYGRLIPEEFLNIPKLGCINIHLSLLPRWRGASPIEHSLMSGDNETGVTIFRLNEKFDCGPILNSIKFKISNTITKEDLKENLNRLGIDLLLSTLPKYLKKEIFLKKQDDSQATYAKKIFNKDRKINFFKNKNEIYNFIRSFSPKPGAWFEFKGENIKILSCETNSIIGKKSTILSNTLDIGCRDGSIKPTIIQREGKKIMDIDQFIRGFNFSIGDQIN
tara:strand:- start:19 stop:942 length:924 start_codon:yes stop_codon:yes gene_type:complete